MKGKVMTDLDPVIDAIVGNDEGIRRPLQADEANPGIRTPTTAMSASPELMGRVIRHFELLA